MDRFNPLERGTGPLFPRPVSPRTPTSAPLEQTSPGSSGPSDRNALSASGNSRFGAYGFRPQLVVVQRQVMFRGHLYNLRYVFVRFLPPQPYRPQPRPTPDARKPQDPPAPSEAPKPAEPTPAPVSAGGGDPDRQAKLDRLRSQLDSKGQAALAQLGSKLDDKDLKTGKTTLDHLYELSEKGVDSSLDQNGISKGKVLSQLVQELAQPGIIHQSNRGTCAATTVQYYMATNHPAEYARMVGGLVNGGQVEMASGKTFVRDPGSIRRDNSTRNDIDRMFQTAAMDRSELGDYRNESDRHVTGAGGLTQRDVTDLMNDFTAGKDGRFQTVRGNDQGMIDRIAQSAAQGTEVPVGMKWSAGGRDAAHELLVTKIEDGKVHLRNPWGQNEAGQGNNGPARQVVSGTGDIVMSLADFQRNLLGASLA